MIDILMDEYIPDDAAQQLELIFPALERNPIPRILTFLDVTVPLYTDEQFVCHFRVQKGVARDLTTRFQQSAAFQAMFQVHGEAVISPQKHTLIFLWFVDHHIASYRDVADRFNLSLAGLFDVITRITDLLMDMAPMVIRRPTNDEKNRTKEYYHQHKDIPGVIGSIDGSHIRIDKPLEDPVAYINRKRYFSIHLQGLVDENRRFLDVVVGWPGSVHDARVYGNSPTDAFIRNICHHGEYVLGDSAYPCLPYLITPFRDNGHLSRARKQFNRMHSSCRVSIEHAFGILKQRFRQLYFLRLRDLRRKVRLIHACCVLHNLASMDDLQFLEPIELDDYPDPEAAGVAIPLIGDDDPIDNVAGRDIRAELCRQLTAP